MDTPSAVLPPPTCSASHIHSLTNLSGSPASQPVTSPLSDSASPESFHSDVASPKSTSSLVAGTSSSAAKNSTSEIISPIMPNPNVSQETSINILATEIKVEACEDDIGEVEQKEAPSDKYRDDIKYLPEEYEMPIHPIVKILLDIEPPIRLTNHVALENETEESLMTSFVKLADTELVDVITWAKNVPGS